MPGRLDGKVAVITGAAGGIGREAALLFSSEGARVCVADVGREAGEKTASECREAFFFAADVSDPISVQAMFEETEKRYGRIDVIYNNAGIMPPDDDSILVTEPEAWDRVQAVNAKGVFLCCQSAARVMIPQKSGRIINMSSIGSKVALPRLLAYCSAKGAINQLTRVLAVEWASHGIRVNAIAPGYVDTDLTRGLRDNPKRLEPMLRQIPLGHLGIPADIVGAAIYLASDASSYVTGHILDVDGGWLAL